MKKLITLFISCTLLFSLASEAQQVEKYSGRTIEATRQLKVRGENVTTSVTGLQGVTTITALNVNDTLNATVNFWNNRLQTVSITDSLKVLASNPYLGAEVQLRIVSDATIRELYFPASWVFVGTKPTTIAASKTGILRLRSYGTTDADIVADWIVQQ